ncbi:hypothetical protein AB1Y20_002730 [Prymnesium parvum]|uniref:Uncharacterized protein n=1 Tax=Prymnesium parvum TaxID=97485 RepID=A0AB34JBT7_PRYPA|mmetsp:Transcript_1692/g.4256  ORF Transcript_1692/g.4256 Transcript_1692/m.4256 type:complete len:121 (-) Transcript_1692:138-500(-)
MSAQRSTARPPAPLTMAERKLQSEWRWCRRHQRARELQRVTPPPRRLSATVRSELPYSSEIDEMAMQRDVRRRSLPGEDPYVRFAELVERVSRSKVFSEASQPSGVEVRQGADGRTCMTR